MMKRRQLVVIGAVALAWLFAGKSDASATPAPKPIAKAKPKPKKSTLESELATAPGVVKQTQQPPGIIEVDSPRMRESTASEIAAAAAQRAKQTFVTRARAAPLDTDEQSDESLKNVSPTIQPQPQGPRILPGYDAGKAKAGSSAISAHLAKKGPAGYSRAQLKIWQTHAGLTADGLYGGSSRGALIYFGVKDPPRPFFKPVATIPYVPPEDRV